MNEKQLLQRLQLLKKNPDIIKPLTNEELAELLLVVLKYIKDVDTGVKQGVIKGDKGMDGRDGKDGKTPVADKDYLSLKTADKSIKQLFEKAKKEIKDGTDGKDAKITDEQINEASERAYQMIQLPDFESLITAEPTAIRDALELLQDDERLEISAIKNLEERLLDIQSLVSRIPAGNAGGGATKQFVIDLVASEIANTAVETLNDIGDVDADSPSDGDVPTWDSTSEKWVSTAPPGASGGEANTVTNIGSAGVGIYKNKVGVDLKFKNINAGSNKVTIIDDTGDDEIDVDIDPSKIATSTLNNDENWANDQTGAEIKIAYEGEADTNAYTDAEKTKLSGVETAADVTDTTNVTAAGALMDSEVDADIKTLSLPASTTISAFGASLVDDADAATARTTLDVDQAGTDNSTDVTLAGTPDYITISGQTITRNAVDLSADVTGALPASDVEIDEIGTATYDDLQDWVNTTQSAGKISGGAFTDNGDGTVAVASGTGIIKTTDSDVGVSKSFDWSADATVSLTDNSVNYIYVDYNAGTPQIAVSTSTPTDHNTKILLGLIYREGTDLHEISAGQVISNIASRIFWKSIEVNGKFQRASGLIASETGTRNLAITAGAVYAGLTKTTISALDTSGADTFTAYYRDGAGGWTKQTAQTAISNQYYDDNSGTLATLDSASGWRPADYGVHWVYLDIDGGLFTIYGQGSYTLTEAQDAQPPSSLPDLLTEVGGLIAKVIIQKDATSFQSIQSAFDVYFTPTGVYDHNSLSGLQGGTADEYYHLTSAQHTIVGNTSGTNTGDESTATDSAEGVVELATDAEMTTGTATNRAVTPANAKVELDKKLALAGGTATGAVIARDHGTASTDEVVNVSYGTGSPPTASTTTEGSLFIKYTA